MNRFSNISYLGHASDMTFRNLSHNDNGFIQLMRELKSPNSENLRKKIFSAYASFRINFPNNESPSGDMQTFCKTIIEHFYNFNFDKMQANFNEISESQLESISLKTKNILNRLLGVTSILCFDESESTEPIKIFFDVKYNYYDFNKLDFDPLEFKIENGFFKFTNHPERINLTIILNTSYLKQLFSSNIEMVEYDPLNPEKSNFEMSIENKFNFKINNAVNKFWRDFLSSFTLSLYKDRYREMFYSQIYAYFYLLFEEKDRNYRLLYASTAEEFRNFFSFYQKFFDKMYLTKFMNKSEKEYGWFEIDLNYCFDLFERKYTDLSPIEVYNALFEICHLEVNTLRVKLGIHQKLEPSTIYSDLDSTISDLNKSYKSDITNLTVTTLLYKRLIPIIVCTEFFFNKGKKHIEVKNLLSKFITKISNLRSFSQYNLITNELEALLDNIDKDVKLFTKSRLLTTSFKMLEKLCRNLAYSDNEALDKFLQYEIERTTNVDGVL